jgi:hypothetical protein
MTAEKRYAAFRPAWFGTATLRDLDSTRKGYHPAIAPALTPVDSQLELRRVNRSEVRGILESNYRDFAPAVGRLMAQLSGIDDPTRHPRKIGEVGYFQPNGYEGTVAYRIRSEDPYDSREYVVRLVFDPDAKRYAERLRKEERRYTALERGLFIDPRYRDRVEHIVAKDPDSYITVTELVEGRSIIDLERVEIDALTVDPIREARDTIIALAECGAKPDSKWPNTLISRDLQHVNFIDYEPLEEGEQGDQEALISHALQMFRRIFKTWWTRDIFEREKQLFQLIQERTPGGRRYILK